MPHERRIFFDLDGEPEPGKTLSLPESEAHHVKNVLRLKTGQELVAVCKNSRLEFDAIVAQLSGRLVQIRLLSARSQKCARSIVKTLAVALLKGSHNDQICEKASELAVENIIVWSAERSIPRINTKQQAERVKRWQRIAESAAKQSGQDFVAEIAFASDISAALQLVEQRSGEDCKLFQCSLSPQARLACEWESAPNSAAIIVGPEGDFAPYEEDVIKEKHALPLSLGPLRLRAETAALVAVATLNAVWGYRALPEKN